MAEGQAAATTVETLLKDAALGRIGTDRRLIRKILEQENPASGILAFARTSTEGHRVNMDPLLTDLLRHLNPAGALEYYFEAIKRDPEDIPDELVEAILPFQDKAVEPLLALYEELGEEQGSDIAFLLAGLRVRDPRVLELLLERLEYDASDGAFCLGLYGDKSALPALNKILAEVPGEDAELRRAIEQGIEQLDEPEAKYEPQPFDIFENYHERELPEFDLLPEEDRLEMFGSEDPSIRAGAAHSFFNDDLNPQTQPKLIELAKTDPEPKVRARAWESLAGGAEEKPLREAMLAVVNDQSKPVEERGGAAVGLFGVADRDEVSKAIEALYEEGGQARAKALEAMWRSLWQPYAKYFAPHLDDKDPSVLRQALRGAGYFRLTPHADKIAKYFDDTGEGPSLREDALFAYALAMPSETTRGRARGMLRKIDTIAGGLSRDEADLVMFALDERMRMHGLEPVFTEEDETEFVDEEPAAVAAPASPVKVGRNDPCPCGSGKKYKKCCGA